MKITAGGLLATGAALVVAAVCVRLGFWQLDRREERRERNAALAEALTLPPLLLRGDSLAAVARRPEAYRYRRVRVTGSYDPEGEVVLRGRAMEGRPGVHLVAPLLVQGSDTAVLVDRGWVAAADGATVDPRPLRTPGVLSVEGILHPLPATQRRAVPLTDTVNGEPVTSVQRLDLAALRGRAPYRLVDAYVQQLPSGAASGASPRPVGLPALDEGPHLGYAVQWFSFAVIAVAGLLLMLWRARRDQA